jgi:hypothetical protein
MPSVSRIVIVCASGVLVCSSAALAQNDAALSPLEVAIACAPPPVVGGQHGAARQVIGGQDTVARTLFGASDLLVVDGGTAAGLQLGQQFFVRRDNRFGTAFGAQTVGTRTLGWITIVAANDSTAVARVDHICDGIVAHDYLEPFARPTVPPAEDRTTAPGEPDFSSLSRVVAGEGDRGTGGAGDFMLIDRGAGEGLAAGTRLAIYRDLRTGDLPLTSIGDAVVVTVGPMLSLTRITRARDAVRTGDYVAVRK